MEMDLLAQIKNKARECKKTIVLPEATEERMIRAVPIVAAEGLADLILLGNPTDILSTAQGLDIDISNAKIGEPSGSPKFDDYSNYSTTFGVIRTLPGKSP